jgi:hypothetical protein
MLQCTRKRAAENVENLPEFYSVQKIGIAMWQVLFSTVLEHTRCRDVIMWYIFQSVPVYKGVTAMWHLSQCYSIQENVVSIEP